MKRYVIALGVFLSGCSVFGDSGVENAPYSVIDADIDSKIEVRQYAPMILVSAKMSSSGQNGAFRKLFRYITGSNQGTAEIAMTAPVFMGNSEFNQGIDIPMTAPVFMDERGGEPTMSFVMPNHFTLETTPQPSDPELWVSEIKGLAVVAIQFNGLLSDSNVKKYTAQLSEWIDKRGFTVAGNPITAGYNGPMTLPIYRRNEVLIKIDLSNH